MVIVIFYNKLIVNPKKQIKMQIVNTINNLSFILIIGSFIELSLQKVSFNSLSISQIFKIREPLISITLSELVLINSLRFSPFLFFENAVLNPTISENVYFL